MLRHLGEKGGIVVYTRHLLEALLAIDSGDEYHLLYRDPALLGGFAHHPRVREVLLPGRSKLYWDQVQVPSYARRQGLDLIFQPKLSVPLVAPCPTAFALHGAEQLAVAEVFPWTNRLYNQVMMPWYCRRAGAVLVLTRTAAADTVRLVGADPAKVHAIPCAQHARFHPVPFAEAEEVRLRYGLPERYLLFVGGLNPLKNFSNLLRAYALLRDRIPQQLVAVGFKRWRFDGDLRQVEELGLDGAVHFPGFLPDEDLPALYSRADLFVLPSLYEGFGIPVAEAMACGCPVVTTTTGCSPEVAGGAAILVDPYDPRAIADGILRALEDEPLRAEMIRKGLVRAAEFSWEKTARETLDLFHTLVAARAEARGAEPVAG
jgi:glycosyltransferase involved in cell wall biosynthesis